MYTLKKLFKKHCPLPLRMRQFLTRTVAKVMTKRPHKAKFNVQICTLVSINFREETCIAMCTIRLDMTLKSHDWNKMCNVTLKDSCGKGNNIDQDNGTHNPHIPSPQLKMMPQAALSPMGEWGTDTCIVPVFFAHSV